MGDAAELAEDRGEVTLEWRLYDRGELFAILPEHGAVDDGGYCARCHGDIDDLTCDQKLTDAYLNLTRNLAIVIALAAAAQDARRR